MSGTVARTVLDTAFGDGARLSALLAARRASGAPGTDPWLHYVAVVPPGWDSDSGPTILRDSPPVRLAPAGDFHRWNLERARLRLTLCAGSSTDVLEQLDIQADEVWWLHPLSSHAPGLRNPGIAAMATRCRRGATVHTTTDWAALDDWLAAGFVPVRDDVATRYGHAAALSAAVVRFAFTPRWAVRRARQTRHTPWVTPARCAIVGAGVSGAALADAMARRAWSVTVWDTEAQPAQGGSGVPAALVAPLPSADDNPATRLTRHGLRWMRQTLHALSAQGLLRQGLDWEASGVTRVLDTGERLRQTEGLWLQPAAVVRAWLTHPRIRFGAARTVARITRQQNLWQLEGENGEPLAQAELVLLANALGCQKLLNFPAIEPRAASALAMLHPVYGTASMGRAGDLGSLPSAPLNGAGSLIPALPDHRPGAPPRWLVGADFSAQALSVDQAHAANLRRMQVLAPDMHAAWLAEPANQAPQALAHWQGQRCVSHDRMPLVGPLLAPPDATLWISVGMGARGMAWAGLCAELLASQVSGEPLPIPRALARQLDSQRRRVYIRNSA